MGTTDITGRILGLAKALHRWMSVLATLDTRRRDRVAKYADEVAATLQRAADGMARLEADPADRGARRAIVRELGRITGYVETIVYVLAHHLDGRKLAGVTRRLEQLAVPGADMAASSFIERGQIERLLAAEGYFRALADGLRA